MKTGTTKKELIAMVVGVLIVLFVLNFLSSRHFLRKDLTEGSEYTLSGSTKEILKNLDDVVDIQIYFSKDLPPALVSLKRSVDDMLSEYKMYAGQKIKVQYIDPQESSVVESQVRMMGIPPVQLNVIQKDKQELVKLYLGIAVVHGDKKEVIPVVQGIGNLEYDLTSAILKVSRKNTPSIAWLGVGEGTSYNQIKAMLKRRYEIKDVAVDNIQLDPAADSLLMLTVGGDLSKEALVIIDNYLVGGGKTFLIIDRINVGQKLETSSIDSSNVLEWLKHNGVVVEDGLLLDKSNTHAAFTGGYVTYHIPYPYWVRSTSQDFDQENSMVSDLDSLILPWVSPLGVEPGESPGVEYTTLVRSSPFNKTVPLDSSLLPEGNQDLIITGMTDPKPLVVFVSGAIKSSYSETVAKEAGLVVVGNARFIQDNFLRQFETNSIFFENVVDFLAMGSELIGIRSKGISDRPIEELSSVGKIFVKYINVLGAPILLIIIGLIILFLRRRRGLIVKSIYK